MSCEFVTFCMAVGYVQAFAQNGSSWTRTKLDPKSNLTSVSCSAGTFCVASDDQGRAFTFDGTSWSAPLKIDHDHDHGGLVDVSCPARNQCTALDSSGYVPATC